MARDPAGFRLYSLIDVVADGARVEDFGVLAVRLAEADRAGARVAQSWVVPTRAFRAHVEAKLPPGHDLASLLRGSRRSSTSERAARAYERLLHEPVEALAEALDGLPRIDDGGSYAVWLSTTLRDSTVLSLAGMFGPHLAPTPMEALGRAWAATHHEQTLRVLTQHGVRELALGAVIQRLPPHPRIIALLTADPERLWHRERGEETPGRSASDERWVLMTGAGPSFSVRDGALLADRVELSSDGRELGRVDIPHSQASERDVPPLDASTLAELTSVAELGARSEPKLAWFCVSDSRQPLLCSLERAIGAGYPEGGEPETVWSRSGLDALLPRVATPLTAGLVERASSESLRNALHELGGRAPKSAPLVQNVQGRAYFNLSALFDVVRTVPGLDPTALLDLIRGATQEEVQHALDLKARSPSLAALSLAAARLASRERAMRESVEEFGRRAQAQRRWLSEMDLAILPDDALKTTLSESYDFFRDTARLLLASSLAFLSAFVAVRAVVARGRPADASRLTHRISAGVGDLATVAPTLALAPVIATAREDEAAARVLRSGVMTLPELPPGPLRRALLGWQESFGDRGLSEPEIEQPRFGERFEPVLAFVRAALSVEGSVEQRMSRVRAEADEALASLEASLSYLETVLLRSLVQRLRGLLRVREEMRVWLAQTVGMLRTVVLDVDRRLLRLDPALARGAAFFLTPSELSSAIGTMRADLGPIVRWRRAGFAHLAGLPDPPEIFVGRPPVVTAMSRSSSLRGEAAGGGAVEGRVRHLSELEQLGPGDVLVVRSLDVGLTPVLPSIAGVIAECGGTLAHGAVVARELGVPTVVGVPNARARLASGVAVRMDGESGIVEPLP
ncbi:MAG: hypothetical protein KF718_20590 [Polyangiaceae bacterium]|nr:hypothetical protein [Polyangiaceae bacterium]